MAEEEINKLKQDLICLQGELESLDRKIEYPAARTTLKREIEAAACAPKARDI